MHDADEPKGAPRVSAKKAPAQSSAELDMEKRIKTACAGERCWRCFRVLCECQPGVGLNVGN